MKFVRARTCTRVRKKGMVLTEMKGFSGTFTHQKNASAFDIKRKCVSLQTQGRFTSNARTFQFKFWNKRTYVFFADLKMKTFEDFIFYFKRE